MAKRIEVKPFHQPVIKIHRPRPPVFSKIVTVPAKHEVAIVEHPVHMGVIKKYRKTKRKAHTAAMEHHVIRPLGGERGHGIRIKHHRKPRKTAEEKRAYQRAYNARPDVKARKKDAAKHKRHVRGPTTHQAVRMAHEEKRYAKVDGIIRDLERAKQIKEANQFKYVVPVIASSHNVPVNFVRKVKQFNKI